MLCHKWCMAIRGSSSSTDLTSRCLTALLLGVVVRSSLLLSVVAPYPADSTAAIMLPSVCSAPYTTCMLAVSRFTCTLRTPASFPTARSTRAEHAEQLMPLTRNLCSLSFTHASILFLCELVKANSPQPCLLIASRSLTVNTHGYKIGSRVWIRKYRAGECGKSCRLAYWYW